MGGSPLGGQYSDVVDIYDMGTLGKISPTSNLSTPATFPYHGGTNGGTGQTLAVAGSCTENGNYMGTTATFAYNSAGSPVAVSPFGTPRLYAASASFSTASGSWVTIYAGGQIGLSPATYL